MGNILKGFFTSDKPLTENQTVLPEQTQEKPTTVLRGPGGKFVSKKNLGEETTENTKLKIKQFEDRDEKPAKEQAAPLQEPILTAHPVTFYGQSIRKWHVNNTWYFSLVDIITITKVIDPLAYIQALEQNEKTKEIFTHNTLPITMTHDEKKETHTCVTYENFIQLLPILRSDACVFPGPFPDWLQDIARLPKE